MKKEIKKGEYWIVNYKIKNKNRSYSGPVLVMDIVDNIFSNEKYPDFSCFVADDIPQNYINRFSGSCFRKKDFVRKTSEKEFLKRRKKFLNSIVKKIDKNLERIS